MKNGFLVIALILLGAAAALFETPRPADKGIGPIREVKLGPLDPALAALGQQLFEAKCSACHALAEDGTGPSLGEVLKRRTPEFVMNQLLNVAEMEEKNETIIELAGKFDGPMPSPNLSAADARAIVEFFRTTGAGN